MSTASTLEILSRSEAQTQDVGRRLGKAARGGELLLLSGDLGTGKTVLVRGLAEGLGFAAAREVRSPSFTLMNLYSGRCVLRHFDVYFTEAFEDLRRNELEEALARGEVVAVEWGERFARELPEDRLEVRMEHVDPGTRRLWLDSGGPGSGAWLKRFREG